MITYVEGNLFDADVQTIVNTINCVGAMGKGVALEAKKRYPDMYVKYKALCDKKLIKVGLLWLYKSEDKWILNFPTKIDWRNPSEVEYLHSGLQKFLDTYKAKGITSIAFPLLGAGNGGIRKEVSLNIMKNYLEKCDIPITIYI